MLGIFDSGSGGLSVMRAIIDIMPLADIRFLGDHANMPYGEKTLKELSILGTALLEKMDDEHVDISLCACNTLSGTVFSKEARQVPKLITMHEGISRLLQENSYKHLTVICTPKTEASHLYQRLAPKHLTVHEVALPLLAHAIDARQSLQRIEEALLPLLKSLSITPTDAIVLGCTHYPLAKQYIAKILAKHNYHLPLLDPSSRVAESVITHHPEAFLDGSGDVTFFSTQPNPNFSAYIQELFPNQGHQLIRTSLDL